MLLKGEYQDDAADQSRKGNEYITAHLQDTVDEEYLSQDQDNAKSNQDDLFERCFGLAFNEAENRDKGEEYSR